MTEFDHEKFMLDIKEYAEAPEFADLVLGGNEMLRCIERVSETWINMGLISRAESFFAGHGTIMCFVATVDAPDAPFLAAQFTYQSNN